MGLGFIILTVDKVGRLLDKPAFVGRRDPGVSKAMGMNRCYYHKSG